MDVPEYRRQVEAELEQAAEQQTSFRELLASRPAARRSMYCVTVPLTWSCKPPRFRSSTSTSRHAPS
jgi:hypothetical protein